MKLYIKRADTTIHFDPDNKGPISLMVGDTPIKGEYKLESSLSPALLSLFLEGLKPEYKNGTKKTSISHISKIKSFTSTQLSTKPTTYTMSWLY